MRYEETNRYLERISAATGIKDILHETISAMADYIERTEERIEKLEALIKEKL